LQTDTIIFKQQGNRLIVPVPPELSANAQPSIFLPIDNLHGINVALLQARGSLGQRHINAGKQRLGPLITTCS
jgi:hypothetical protein